MRKIGLVLAGGGGRGAYQIGVWKALNDAGLEKYITSVSGASVGGLNAALFVQRDLNQAQSIWESISMNKILTPKLDSQHSGRFSLFERDGLETIIDENLDMKCFDDNECNCWMACVRTEDPSKGIEEIPYTTPIGEKVTRKYVYKNVEYFNLKYVKDNVTRKKIILGTSAMPFVFPKEKIEGYEYSDGGARVLHGDNVPVKPLYEVDKCNIILIVHLTNMDEPINRKDFPGAKLYELFPKDSLGGLFDVDGMFDFSAEGAKKRIKMGYEDTYELFKQINSTISRAQGLEDILKEGCKKERQYARVEEAQRQEFARLMQEYERK